MDNNRRWLPRFGLGTLVGATIACAAVVGFNLSPDYVEQTGTTHIYGWRQWGWPFYFREDVLNVADGPPFVRFDVPKQAKTHIDYLALAGNLAAGMAIVAYVAMAFEVTCRWRATRRKGETKRRKRLQPVTLVFLPALVALLAWLNLHPWERGGGTERGWPLPAVMDHVKVAGGPRMVTLTPNGYEAHGLTVWDFSVTGILVDLSLALVVVVALTSAFEWIARRGMRNIVKQ